LGRTRRTADAEAPRILQAIGISEGEFETVAIPQVVYRSPFFGTFARMNTASVRDGYPSLVINRNSRRC
jgi:3-(3-hydroxy-phenyl)propionate hydroxylase